MSKVTGKDATQVVRVAISEGFQAVDALLGANPKHIAYIIIIILVLFICSWCFTRLNKNEKNCKLISEVYSKFPLLTTLDVSTLKLNNKLRDYYVKTAYNCCSSGNYKNDFVNLCALKNCIKQGARCLDFEIYSIDNKPVIATSSFGVNYKYKETYNHVDFSKAMSIINTYAFSSGTCPNPGDPLILHFRIMSSITNIHNMIATAIYETIGSRLLDKNFSYEMRGLNIGAYAISSLMGKIIIIVDKSNSTFYNSKLHEYVNLSSSTPLMRCMRFSDVEFCPDIEELVFFNKEQMTIVLPSYSSSSKNVNSSIAMSRGCQFIGMSFQNFDVNMEFYTKYFDETGHAFRKREERFRYEPQFIPIPAPQLTCLSLKSVTTTLGNSNITVALTSGESCNTNSLTECHPLEWVVKQIGSSTNPSTTSPDYPIFLPTNLDHVKMGGSGAGLVKNNESDSFTFFCNKIRLHGALTTNVDIPVTGSIGIMIRGNLEPKSKYILIGVETVSTEKNVYMETRNNLVDAPSSTNNVRQRTILHIVPVGTTSIFIRITRIDATQFGVACATTIPELDTPEATSNTQTINFTTATATATATTAAANVTANNNVILNDPYIGFFVYSGNTSNISTTFKNVKAYCK